jgi:hypothetical protein
MNDEIPEAPSKRKSPAPALILGFLPSVILLAAATVKQPPNGLLFFCCIIAVICCFTSSVLLFRRGTSLAIVGGIAFLLLNAVISLFFGCASVVRF